MEAFSEVGMLFQTRLFNMLRFNVSEQIEKYKESLTGLVLSEWDNV